ncbi:hypothetical protein GCM10009613_49440 [Pseudonocardia kongjuensis]|uniref:DUF1648 domain-containing protein n=1 Tax=Pseudonocardia kongjuensis TaxID=102227 RepID=A0ABN1Y5W9_9PSEU
MRPWFPLLAGSVFYAAALLWAATELPPDGVPLHFDAGGTPTWFGTRTQFLGFGALFGLFMIGTGAGLYALVARGPLGAVSVPHKEYWMHPRRAGRLRRMLAEDMGRLFGAVVAFLALVPVAAVHATRVDPPRLPVGPVWVAVTVLVLGIVAWCVWQTRYRYRPPA